MLTKDTSTAGKLVY